jgi:transposase
MSKVIMAGCDLHDRSMLIRYAVDSAEPQQLTFKNDATDRKRMILRLKSLAKKSGVKRIVFAYEASGLGYGLADQLHEEGIECHILSPTQLPKTRKAAKAKTDAKDAQMLLEQLRGHILAGNKLPVVWTPPQRLREDRELIRARIDIADETTRIKNKLLCTIKRYGVVRPDWYTPKWSKRFVRWLRQDVIATLDLAVGAVLEQLVDQYEHLIASQAKLNKAVKELSREKRYAAAFQKLRTVKGVGVLTAMSFLTEMGDLHRFANRRQVAAYLGLCPASYESGETNDRKGRITRQGPTRLRRVLCQAAWTSVIHCEQAQQDYQRIKQGQKKRNKKAIVALMRKLGIRMWHVALSAGVSSELEGRGGPSALATV